MQKKTDRWKQIPFTSISTYHKLVFQSLTYTLLAQEVLTGLKSENPTDIQDCSPQSIACEY